MRRTLLGAALVVLSFQVAQAVTVNYNFDDGLQGWTNDDPFQPFGGTLEHSTTGGNLGGYMFAIDTQPFGLLVRAPAAVAGDLTKTRFTWDVLLPTTSRNSTGIFIEGQDGSIYNSDQGLTSATLGSWFSKSVDTEDEVEWQLAFAGSASSSFADVVSDAAAVYVNLEVIAGSGVEAGIDNFNVSPVPVPAALPLMLSGLGLLGFIARRRKG